jgi:hypothetical protein
MARFNSGWVKAWRRAAESDLVDSLGIWGLWHWLLYAATWKPSKKNIGGEQVVLPPGTVLFSPTEISRLWGCARSTVQEWLKYLVKTGRVSVSSSNLGTIVTICNWETYQGEDVIDADASRQDAGHEPAADRQQTGSEPALSEESKKERKNTRRSRAEYDPAFEEIYSEYPRHEGKSAGHKIYLKISQEEIPLLKTAIQNYRRKKAGTEVRYLKLFSTFMGEWRDWLDAKTGTAVKPSGALKEVSVEEVFRGTGS